MILLALNLLLLVSSFAFAQSGYVSNRFILKESGISKPVASISIDVSREVPKGPSSTELPSAFRTNHEVPSGPNPIIESPPAPAFRTNHEVPSGPNPIIESPPAPAFTTNHEVPSGPNPIIEAPPAPASN
ncbi:hypothetical protein FRX31_016698 [Thalictrum thalictroides]|uniref:Uncharacterized protein n=1 Tax=Thalictrum thalictroides TaxID=46969 RepID=A0A7J6W9V0_THATH|nr:hypothetical protein FRX31_016698 [Thalictrum thalictroides]